MSILTVDYASANAPALFSQSLKETGFAVLCGHPISIDLIHDAYKQWSAFFLEDDAAKQKYLYRKETQDGFFPFRSENAKNYKKSDLKEFFHIYPWGQIPTELRDISIRLYDALNQFSLELLQWIENHLPANVAKELSMPLNNMTIDSPQTLLRILHYPPLDEQHEGAERAAPHEDINLITLLPAATAPGLEVLDSHNQWHAVSCDPGSIVVNVGDMLQMCTQYYYKSTTHRVVNPRQTAQNGSRFSMPFFLHPRREVQLSPTLTAIEFLQQRLREIGIY